MMAEVILVQLLFASSDMRASQSTLLRCLSQSARPYCQTVLTVLGSRHSSVLNSAKMVAWSDLPIGGAEPDRRVAQVTHDEVEEGISTSRLHHMLLEVM